MNGLVADTWGELGGRIEAMGFQVWVRTLPFERKIGSIWMPPKLQNFHGELPHLVTVRAMVLAAGPNGPAAQFKPGDIIHFQRLHFAQYKPVGNPEDQEKVGWINSNEILWIEEEDANDDVRTTAA